MGIQTLDDATRAAPDRDRELTRLDAGDLPRLGESDHRTSTWSAPPGTRRTFIKVLTGAIVATSGALGKIVAFTPTSAEAVEFGCVPLAFFCDFSCFGACDTLQSCCRMTLEGDNCCCTCSRGPGQCSPLVFKARGICNVTNDRCCCATGGC